MSNKHVPRTPDEVWEFVETDEAEALEAEPPAEVAAIHRAVPTRLEIEGRATDEPTVQGSFDDEEPDVFAERSRRSADDEELSVTDLLVAQHYLAPEE